MQTASKPFARCGRLNGQLTLEICDVDIVGTAFVLREFTEEEAVIAIRN